MTKQSKIVLKQLQKALITEEKQGCTNTGVVGGFHLFLRGVLNRLRQLEPSEEFTIIKEIANRYASWSPLERRQSLGHLRIFIEEAIANVDPSINPQPQNKPNFPAKNHEEISHPEKSYQETSYQETRNSLNTQEGSAPEIPVPVENPVPVAKKPFQARKTTPQKQGTPKEGSLKEASPKEGARKEGTSNKPASLQYLKGVGPERGKQLANLGIHTVQDLFFYFPRRYEDRSLRKIAELKDGELASVAGKVVAGQVSHGKIKVVKLSIEQDGRLIYGVWFNQTYILKQYPVGTSVIVTGKVRWQHRVPEIQATDIQKSSSKKPSEILPVYGETARLSSKGIRNILSGVLSQAQELFPEFLPPEEQNKWLERPQAYREIHFPKSFQSLGQARERLVYEEILFLQLAVARLRKGVAEDKDNSPLLLGKEELLKKFFAQLPYELTNAQKRVIQEVFRDMARTKGMARLIQGDVGSGKTVVAMAALLQAVGSGYQGAMMAPTEILALQHYQSLVDAFTPLDIHVVCLLGSQSKGERDQILAQISSGQGQVVVGTHALIQESVEFHSLGLAITDEQHRFGVKQRTTLQTKGENPHVLVLTATPIPRTLALTLYGDLQLSVLDEMPQGRKPVITRKLTERSRAKLENFMEEQIDLGRQIYVVCPLVEESEHMDLISATQRYESLQERFPNRQISLLHGRMKGVEKEEIMKEFQKGNIDVLVSTTVVEVGVNVPNASVMVIEGAERFGLAQLHQLRGRVGRGSEQSYCFLISDSKSSRRLDVLCETQDGFKIAEEDLRIRGAGELLGTKQHGMMELRLADLSRDGALVEKAYQMAQKVLAAPEKYDQIWQEAERFFPLDTVGLN